MNAAVFERYGPPDVVGMRHVETPTHADDELLVNVHATTVNRIDCEHRRADPFMLKPGGVSTSWSSSIT